MFSLVVLISIRRWTFGNLRQIQGLISLESRTVASPCVRATTKMHKARSLLAQRQGANEILFASRTRGFFRGLAQQTKMQLDGFNFCFELYEFVRMLLSAIIEDPTEIMNQVFMKHFGVTDVLFSKLTRDEFTYPVQHARLKLSQFCFRCRCLLVVAHSKSR